MLAIGDIRRAGLGGSRIVVVAIAERDGAAAIDRRRVSQGQLTASSQYWPKHRVKALGPLQPGGNALPRPLVILIAVAGLPSSVVKVSVTGTEPLLTTALIDPLGAWVATKLLCVVAAYGDCNRARLRSAGVIVVAVIERQRAAGSGGWDYTSG